MFLKLAHTKMEVYKESRQLTLEVYKLTRILPDEERYNLVSQLRRAALSVHLNIAEGSSRKSEVEKKRYYEIARGSVIEIDAALDIVVGLGYAIIEELKKLGANIVNTFKLICGLIDKQTVLTNEVKK